MANKNVILKDGNDYLFPKTKAELVDGLSDRLANKITNPMTAQYDIIYGGVGGAPTRLAKGVGVLHSSPTGLNWGQVDILEIICSETSSNNNKVPYSDNGYFELGKPGNDFGLGYLTTAPSAANTDGLKIVVLSSEPATKYDGYLYIITGA